MEIANVTVVSFKQAAYTGAESAAVDSSNRGAMASSSSKCIEQKQKQKTVKHRPRSKAEVVDMAQFRLTCPQCAAMQIKEVFTTLCPPRLWTNEQGTELRNRLHMHCYERKGTDHEIISGPDLLLLPIKVWSGDGSIRWYEVEREHYPDTHPSVAGLPSKRSRCHDGVALGGSICRIPIPMRRGTNKGKPCGQKCPCRYHASKGSQYQ